MVEALIGVIIFIMGVAFGYTIKGDFKITKTVITEGKNTYLDLNETIPTPYVKPEEDETEEQKDKKTQEELIFQAFDKVQKIFDGTEEFK